MGWGELTDTEHTGRADPPPPPPPSDTSSGPRLFASLIAVLILAALLPAYVKLVGVIAEWSWQLIG